MSAQYGIPALFAFGSIDKDSPLAASPTEFAMDDEAAPVDADAEEASGVHTQVLTGQAEAVRVLYQLDVKSA